jgi:hypothetical protein
MKLFESNLLEACGNITEESHNIADCPKMAKNRERNKVKVKL